MTVASDDEQNTMTRDIAERPLPIWKMRAIITYWRFRLWLQRRWGIG